MTLDDLDISISEKNKSIFTKDNSIEMKYFLSISLLLLVMHLTVHPILSLHFCSGKLASTEFFSVQENDDCCGNSSSQEQETTCKGEHLVKEKCCNTSVLRLSGDEFEHISDANYSHTLKPVLFLSVRTIVSLLLSYDLVSSLNSYAPPEQLFTTGRELLARICILVI